MTTGSINPLAGYNPPHAGPIPIQDIVYVQGNGNPGICKISGFRRKFHWDKKGGKGAWGQDITATAKDAAIGKLLFYVWTEFQFVQWETFLPLFSYDPTRTKLQAVTIFIPMLQDLGITQIVAESIGPFEHQGASLWTREIDVIEWSPPPKGAAVATPTAAQSGRNGPVVNPQAPDATNPLITKIQSLATQFQQT